MIPGRARVLVALIENHQQADGAVKVSVTLQPYMGGKTKIGSVPFPSKAQQSPFFHFSSPFYCSGNYRILLGLNDKLEFVD